MAFAGTSDGHAARVVQHQLDHCVTQSTKTERNKAQIFVPLWGWPSCSVCKAAHSKGTLMHCLPRGDGDRMVPLMWHSPTTHRTNPQAFCGWGPQSLSLSHPASCWVIASSNGKDSHGNGAAPSVFSHIPPQARVIVTFLCKTPCKTGKLFSFFLNQRQAGFAMTTSAHLSLPTRQFPLQSDSECNKM